MSEVKKKIGMQFKDKAEKQNFFEILMISDSSFKKKTVPLCLNFLSFAALLDLCNAKTDPSIYLFLLRTNSCSLYCTLDYY